MSKYPVPVRPKTIVSARPVSLHPSASSIAQRIAWADSGAGRVASVRARSVAAPKTYVCSTLVASISFWS